MQAMTTKYQQQNFFNCLIISQGVENVLNLVWDRLNKMISGQRKEDLISIKTIYLVHCENINLVVWITPNISRQILNEESIHINIKDMQKSQN